MKILCVADTVAPLVYSSHIKERFSDIDLVLGAGDLPVEYLEFIASSLNKPVLFVFGNHNLKQMDHFKKRGFFSSDPLRRLNECTESYASVHIDRRSVRYKGLLVAGLGGSIRYNSGDNQFSDRQMFRRILALAPRLLWNRIVHGRYLDILLAHSAPLGINDKDDECHRGFGSFLWFIKRFRPRYLIHGHIHLYDQNAVRERSLLDTRIINVYDHYRLTVDL